MSVSTRRARILAAVGLTALVGPLALVASPAVAVPGGDELGIYANPGDTVTVKFSAQPDHYEWTVPSGVTEITVDLAAGSGASYDVNPELSPGGVGGWLTLLGQGWKPHPEHKGKRCRCLQELFHNGLPVCAVPPRQARSSCYRLVSKWYLSVPSLREVKIVSATAFIPCVRGTLLCRFTSP